MLLLMSCHVDFLLEKLYNTSYSFKKKYGFSMKILQNNLQIALGLLRNVTPLFFLIRKTII